MDDNLLWALAAGAVGHLEEEAVLQELWVKEVCCRWTVVVEETLERSFLAGEGGARACSVGRWAVGLHTRGSVWVLRGVMMGVGHYETGTPGKVLACLVREVGLLQESPALMADRGAPSEDREDCYEDQQEHPGV